MRKKIWVVENDPIYNNSWGIHLGGTQKSATNWLVQHLGVKTKFPSSGYPQASVFYTPNFRPFVVWFREMPETPTPTPDATALVAHEALHATVHVLRHAGVGPIGDDTEEAYSYYLGYVVREIHKRLWRNA